MTPLLGAVLAYLAIQFGIGVWASRRIKDEQGYLVAGRTLGYSLATFSIFATWFGAETIVGSAGTAYANGLSLAQAEPFGYGLCLVLMGAVFAAPLWSRGLTTLADLFRQRFSADVERLAAVVMIPASVLWAAAQVRAFGQVVASASTLSVETGLALAAGFVVLYTMFGGMLADAMTDLVQGLVMVLGLALVGLVLLVRMDGVETVAASVHATTEGLTLLAGLEEWLIPICGSVVAAELVQRVIACRSPMVARRAAIGAGGLYVLVGLIPVWIGLAGAGLGLALDDPEQVVPMAARQYLPAAVYVVFIGALISAILSTVDSILLAAGGMLSRNVVAPLAGVTDDRTRLRMARGAVLLFGVVAWILAHRAEGVFALVEDASAFGSAGVLVTVTGGLFTSWGGPATAGATLAGGVVAYLAGVVLGWPYPFLTSLAASLVLYAGGAALERRQVA